MDLGSTCHHVLKQLPSLLPYSILLASFLGSIHCVGMCGGLIMASTKGPKSVITYHIGRLLGYMTLGISSGSIGKILMKIPIIPVLFGISFIVIGIISLNKINGFHFKFATPILEKIIATKKKYPPYLYAGLIGLFSIALPCGWLYTYVLAVSQLQNPILGAGLMALFWLGTLPALIASPLIAKRFLRPISQRVTAIIFIIVGILTLLYRI